MASEGKFFWGYCCGATLAFLLTGRPDMAPATWGACIVGHFAVKAIDHLSPRILPKLQAKSAALPRRHFYGPLVLVGLFLLWPAVMIIVMNTFAGIPTTLESVVLYYARLYDFFRVIVPACIMSIVFIVLMMGLLYWIAKPPTSTKAAYIPQRGEVLEVVTAVGDAQREQVH